MKIVVYSGMEKTSDSSGSELANALFESDLARYAVTDGNFTCSLWKGFAKLPFKTGDLLTVNIKDEVNGDLSFLATFTSYNYVVYNRPENTDTVVGDNTLLFRIILQY